MVSGHSITSSARARIDGGIVRPSAFAVWRLTADSALQPHLDQMQHTPVDDPTRYRFHEFGMGNAPKEIREVGIDDFPVSAKQQFFDLDRRLLGVPPRPAGVFCSGRRSASKIGPRTNVAAVMQTRSRTLERGHFVKVDCTACDHLALLTPEVVWRAGLPPARRFST